jgi:hypothetical protein
MSWSSWYWRSVSESLKQSVKAFTCAVFSWSTDRASIACNKEGGKISGHSPIKTLQNNSVYLLKGKWFVEVPIKTNSVSGPDSINPDPDPSQAQSGSDLRNYSGSGPNARPNINIMNYIPIIYSTDAAKTCKAFVRKCVPVRCQVRLFRIWPVQ